MRIRFDQVSFTHAPTLQQPRYILNNIGLEWDTRQITGICGVAGSGKTTLIHHLNGLVSPTSGRILIDNDDIHRSKAALRQIRRRIGMTFQFPERQLFGRTVWEEFTYTLEQRRLPQSEIEQRVRRAADLLTFDLDTLRESSPFSLTRREQRLLGIAVILALQPEFFVLDEPTAGMDRANAAQVFDLLRTLHHEGHSHILFVTHDMELLLKYAEQLLVIHDGEILFSGPTQQILEQPAIFVQTGIPLPPMYQTLHILQQCYPQLSPAVKSVDDAVAEILTYIH